MEKIWIAEKGTCKEESALELLNKNKGENKFFIALYTDCFDAGYFAGADIPNISRLLEIRVFCENEELLMRRSRIGTDFQWRIASDKARQENYKKYMEQQCERDDLKINLPPKEEMIYDTRYQLLDINDKYSWEHNEEEKNTKLFTTVGGSYKLPIKKGQNAIKVMSYLEYDENGVATISDSRLCGFGTIAERGV